MNEITIPTNNVPATTNFLKSAPDPSEIQVLTLIAETAVDSKQYKGVGDKAALLMNMLAARELNIPPILSLNGGIRNINGNIEISARLMHALMRRAGIFIQIKESTEQKCVIYGKRQDGSYHTASYEYSEAQKAGLIKPGGGWTKNPKDMLFARAISRLARQLAPDVIGGCYVEGEISGDVVVAPSGNSDPSLFCDSATPEDLSSYEDIIKAQLPEESEPDIIRYIEAMMGHFGWTYAKAVKSLAAKPEGIKPSFDGWRKKNG